METHPENTRDAAVIVARDASGLVAVLTARFPQHGGEYLFLPGGRLESGETPADGARRELREEAGITASSWQHLGTYAITLNSPARMSLHLAENLTLGRQHLAEGEEDFKLMWLPMADALDAAAEGRFLLPGGPLALHLAERRLSA
ncbi:NUDIX domain-containing protein [Streptomyces sp. NPDC051555]|uniref:NUDIX domain-containing protein n=1 Tax=Streptomyces sp. NPDC051555 TaxID=3365657 RepID=UPI0037A4E1D5